MVLAAGGAIASEAAQVSSTPLHCAAECGKEVVVAYLVGQGADIEAKDSVSVAMAVRLNGGCCAMERRSKS